MGMNSTPARAQPAHRVDDVRHRQRGVLHAVAAVVLGEDVDLRGLEERAQRLVVGELDAATAAPSSPPTSGPSPRSASASTSLVWNSTAQNCSMPITCSIHSSAGVMVWKFEVRWSMRLKPKRFSPPRGASCSCQAREERAVALPLDEAEGGVAERRGDREHGQRAAVVAEALDVADHACRRAPPAGGRCARCPRPRRPPCRRRRGACAGSARRGRPRRAGAQTTRLTSPAWNTADFCRPRAVSSGAGLADLGEVQLAQHEVAHPLQVVHVVHQRGDLADAQRLACAVMWPSSHWRDSTVCSMAPKTLRPAPSSTSIRIVSPGFR